MFGIYMVHDDADARLFSTGNIGYVLAPHRASILSSILIHTYLFIYIAMYMFQGTYMYREQTLLIICLGLREKPRVKFIRPTCIPKVVLQRN